MDPSVQPPPVASKPLIHPSLSSRPILITVFLVTILLSFLAGYFLSKFNNSRNQSATIPNKSNPSIPAVATALNISLPIETSSSAVKSLYAVYLLSGVIDSITPVINNNKNGYEIQISSPTGPLVDQKFFANNQTTNVVSLDKQNKETKYQLSMLKKGDPIQINYQLNIKKSSEAQVTKIMVLQ